MTDKSNEGKSDFLEMLHGDLDYCFKLNIFHLEPCNKTLTSF